jgi:aminoglycoside phosphotransferase
MTIQQPHEVTAFEGTRRIASGPLASVAPKIQEAMARGTGTVLIFDDRTGDQIDVDVSRLPTHAEDGPDATEPEEPDELRRPGRPRLGVVPREVTLLPRHWEWLGRQPGGASAALRRIVEQARRLNSSEENIRAGREALYRFMTAMAGDAGGYEEAIRALFAGDAARFSALTTVWPTDVRDHIWRLAPAAFGYASSPLDLSIPFLKREAVLRACQNAFGGAAIHSVARITKGASGAGVFKLTVDGRNYLLRIEGPSDGFRDPHRQYACLRIAAEAAVAPRLIYADSKEGIAITDFISADLTPAAGWNKPELVRTLTRTVKVLHAAPLFPPLVNYLEGVGSLMSSCLATGILPAKALEKHRRYFGELVKAYPGEKRGKADFVSSHNDLNPGNVLFQGDKAWLVDWESAFAADRYVDLAAIANFFAAREHERELMLQIYFGSGLRDYHRARLFLMQQANRIFYAMVIFNFMAAVNPETRLKRSDLKRIRLSQVLGEMANLQAQPDKTRFACAFLHEALVAFESPAFAKAIALVANSQQPEQSSKRRKVLRGATKAAP